MILVSHAESALGGRIIAKLLCGRERVRALVSAAPPTSWSRRQLTKLRTSGAEVFRSPPAILLNGQGGAPERVEEVRHAEAPAAEGAQRAPPLRPSAHGTGGRIWRGVTTAVYLPATNVHHGKEVVASLSDAGLERFIERATEAGVQRVVLVATPPPFQGAGRSLDGVYAAAERGTLELALFVPTPPPGYAPLVTLEGGHQARLLERRRLLLFLPLQPLADALAYAASSPVLPPNPIALPAEVRRYSSVLGAVETMLEQTAARGPGPEDALWAELVMGSPLKVVTAGVARTLGLEFPPAAHYLARVLDLPT